MYRCIIRLSDELCLVRRQDALPQRYHFPPWKKWLLLFARQVPNIYCKMRAYFMDSSTEDCRLPHELDPPQPVSKEHLAKVGVLYWHLPAAAEKCVLW